MSNPTRINSGCYCVWFRPDLPREDIQAYWKGPHGHIANQNPAIQEYLQHHFSASDHGFWPVPRGVGGSIPKDWHMDGLTEVRIQNLWTALKARFFHMKENFLDEENIFDRVLGKTSTLGGGCWWTGPYQPAIACRTVLFIRAHHAKKGKPFQQFVNDILAPALMAAGAHELRTHIFQPGGRLMHLTPGVLHDEPANRYYDAAVIIGVKDRMAFNSLLTSVALHDTQIAQQKFCVAMHAYGVESTYPLVLDGKPQSAG